MNSKRIPYETVSKDQDYKRVYGTFLFFIDTPYGQDKVDKKDSGNTVSQESCNPEIIRGDQRTE